jgi:ribosomal protein L11 methyltransferase
MQKFIVLHLEASEEFSDILQAELAEIGFDSFMDNEAGFTASVSAENFDRESFDAVVNNYAEGIKNYNIAEQELQNWNQLWESHYEPVEIADLCYVRAHFHPEKPHFKYQILITPKMSFGTGHHATTRMMLEHLLENDIAGKKVLDLGCGTAVLAIMADKLGASEILGCDIDDWVIENAEENIALNQSKTKVFLGTVKAVPAGETYEIILANINLHVLREEFSDYEKLLAKCGLLFMSGFLEEDIPVLERQATELGLRLVKAKTVEAGNWASVVFSK